MLKILSQPRRVCGGVTRREALQVAGAGLLGVNFADVLAAQQATPTVSARARSVIFIYLYGGPSQLESFDMKPEAPTGIRGPFRPIAARTPGLRICELLPQLANMSDQFAVIRTLNHPQNDHNGCHYIQTGHPLPPAQRGAANVDATERDWPAMGSVVEYLDRQRRGHRAGLPSYLYVPNRLGHIQGYDRSGQYAGWLGRTYNALATRVAKRDKNDNPYFRPCTDEELTFRVDGLDPNPGVTLDRLDTRLRLLDQLDQQRRQLDALTVQNFDRFRERALDLVTSEGIRRAFEIGRESPQTRDRYGRHLFGQSALLTRRLIEAGARFVTLLWDAPDGNCWDSHIHCEDLRRFLLPGLDQTLSALLVDLKERGLLDETLIVCLGEMGRSPQPANGRWGRNHWSYCFPALLAGAGIRGGALLGRSDRQAGYPVEEAVSPEDLAATVFHSLGIGDARIHDSQGRPIPLLERGNVLHRLFG